MKKGLEIKRFFTQDNVPVWDQFKFVRKRSLIRAADGSVVFEMNNVEVPEQWSQIATDVLAQKYFRRTGVPDEEGGETSVRQIVHRLADCWKFWGLSAGYFQDEHSAEIFYDEVTFMLLDQRAAPNSPQWFNTGLYNSYGISGAAQGHYYMDPESNELRKSTSAYERPQPHACFILGVQDDLVNPGGIMDLWLREARIFKYGSGTGSNFSAIRGAGEKLSGGGKSSGLLSFLRIGDRSAGAIRSGGTTRRAAKMVCVDADHPEILSFIRWKADEEKKAAALISAGYGAGLDGEAYQSVSGQNANYSVRFTNDFFSRLANNEDWDLINRTDGKISDSVPAKFIWDELCNASWQCADPGVQFSDTINDWHTCPAGGKINASNPCSEYMFLDDTACNLASVNLVKFYDEATGVFNTGAFRHACRLWTIVLEISVHMAQYPSPEVALNSFHYRTLGLGYANLGALIMRSGLAYDSEEGRALAAGITSLMTAQAYYTSAELASVKGPFKEFENNRNAMLRVLENHAAAANVETCSFSQLQIIPPVISSACPDYLLNEVRETWKATLSAGNEWGFRNAQVTVLAPTGTIGLLMDCDTTGVEPDYSLVKYKKLVGGGYFRIVNQSVKPALVRLGYSKEACEEILAYVNGHHDFTHAPGINKEKLIAKNFTRDEIAHLEKLSENAVSLHDIFRKENFSKERWDEISDDQSAPGGKDDSILRIVGFTEEEIVTASLYVCGHLTVEGSILKEEHLPVFDCANRCLPYGTRFISAEGHLKMMAAVQPFLSGAISKTINLPSDASRETISDCYLKGYKLGLKAVALYRDGSKLIQPLESGNKPMQISDSLRSRLPAKRKGITQRAVIGKEVIYLRTGEYEDGRVGEIFIDDFKGDPDFRALLSCFAVSVSLGLQYGVPLEEFVRKFIFTQFEPGGPVDHPHIKMATSIPDFIFRLLAYEYLGRNDLVQVPGNVSGREMFENTSDTDALDHYLSGLMGDAPSCPTCGISTIRSGSCFRCINCGTTLGCS